MKKLVSFLLVLMLAFGYAQPASFADFKILDSIQEFGEKRFMRTRTARLQTGPVKIYPKIDTKIEYDDNILLEDEDAREDVIFDVTPGVILELPIDTHQLAVGYEADFENFVKRTDQNDQNQNFFALADVNFPSWYINVLEKFSETSGRAGTTFESRVPRFDQSIYPKIGYRWKRFTIEQGFRHFVRDFRRQVSDSFDFQMVQWSTVLFYDMTARLKALAEYTYGQIDYDDAVTRGGSLNQMRLGLEGEIRPDLFVRLKVGPHLRNYKKSTEVDFNSWVGSLELEYDFRSNIHFELEGYRDAVEATFQDVNFYKQHGIRFLGEYEFQPHWTAFSETEYYRNDYAERATVGRTVAQFRDDNHILTDLGLRYAFREWMEFELAYHFKHRESNFPEFDYTDHRVSLTSSISY